LYNNNIKSVVGLKKVLDTVLVNGADKIVWLDLAWNQIKEIEEVRKYFFFFNIF
jgi:hypothetical protein